MSEADIATVDDTDLVAFHVGDHVRDRDAEDDATLLVVGLPLQRAGGYTLGEDTETTVADANPQYDAAEPVVEVIYPQRTDVDVGEQSRYAFPAERLELVSSVHDRDDTDADAATDPTERGGA